MKIKIEARYSTRSRINLFGWWISLWRTRRGAVDWSREFHADFEFSERFGPLTLTVHVDAGGLMEATVSLAGSGLEFPISAQTLDFSGVRRFPFLLKADGANWAKGEVVVTV